MYILFVISPFLYALIFYQEYLQSGSDRRDCDCVAGRLFPRNCQYISITGRYPSSRLHAGGALRKIQRRHVLCYKLKDGIITDATFQGNPQGKRAQQFQDLFASGYKELVVGKSINEVSLGVVNGSSLTSKGFMDAVQQIRTQAAAS